MSVQNNLLSVHDICQVLMQVRQSWERGI